MFELTPEVYEMQVNYELNDLHSSQVLLPLQRMEKKWARISGRTSEDAIVSTDPDLSTAGSGIIIVVCVLLRKTQGMHPKVHLHIRT